LSAPEREAVSALIKTLEEGDDPTRRAAVEALRENIELALPSLIEATTTARQMIPVVPRDGAKFSDP
jgi:HEAT repeat protein